MIKKSPDNQSYLFQANWNCNFFLTPFYSWHKSFILSNNFEQKTLYIFHKLQNSVLSEKLEVVTKHMVNLNRAMTSISNWTEIECSICNSQCNFLAFTWNLLAKQSREKLWKADSWYRARSSYMKMDKLLKKLSYPWSSCRLLLNNLHSLELKEFDWALIFDHESL